MKIRSLLIAGLLVGGFVYLTSVANWDLSAAVAGRLTPGAYGPSRTAPVRPGSAPTR